MDIEHEICMGNVGCKDILKRIFFYVLFSWFYANGSRTLQFFFHAFFSNGSQIFVSFWRLSPRLLLGTQGCKTDKIIAR